MGEKHLRLDLERLAAIARVSNHYEPERGDQKCHIVCKTHLLTNDAVVA